jgi:abequosyltransferase
LESILSQTNGQVEITICDNGSVDATPAVISSYMQKYPWIKHHRFEKNVGPDRCFCKSIEIAQGKYCWFLGDDDTIEKGSIQKVLNALDQHEGLSGISVNRKIFDSNLLNELKYEPVSPGLTRSKLYHHSNECIHQLFSYFGYMSGQICRKDLWMQAFNSTQNIEKYFNAYIILFLIVKVIQNKPHWLYLDTAYVKYRANNDSFSKELGQYKRFLLDAVGYENLALGLFGRFNVLYRSCLDQIGKTHLRARIISLKNEKAPQLFSLKILWVLIPRYWMTTSFWVVNLPLLLMPNFLYSVLRTGKKRFLSISNSCQRALGNLSPNKRK